ncbi:MAG: hypothetical protein WC393_02230 [Candidatus Nanoarchaeia archaeon]
MNFKQMVEDAKPDAPIIININWLTIKNKGSIMKMSSFYIDFYNDLIEKWGLKCTETSFTQTDIDQTSKTMLWDWVAYKNIDDFARISFILSTNAYRISGDTVMGIFAIKYNLELDYTRTWRKNSFTKMILPIYLRTNYQSKLLTYAAIYMEELNAIKEKLMERLNMNVYD